MLQGNQNFLDRILDKRATYGETLILSVIIGFPIYYFLGDVNTLEKEGRFVLFAIGFPILVLIRKCYWSFRMKKFLVENSYYLMGRDKEAFLRYYHNHAWKNVYYYYGFWDMDRELKLSQQRQEEYMKDRLKLSQQRQEEYMKDRWTCPRCQRKVPDVLYKCLCGQPNPDLTEAQKLIVERMDGDKHRKG